MNNSLVNLVNALALERRQDCRKFKVFYLYLNHIF